MARAVCSRCGGMCGEPGANFGDYGWHPCYHCGATGECACPECTGDCSDFEHLITDTYKGEQNYNPEDEVPF